MSVILMKRKEHISLNIFWFAPLTAPQACWLGDYRNQEKFKMDVFDDIFLFAVCKETNR